MKRCTVREKELSYLLFPFIPLCLTFCVFVCEREHGKEKKKVGKERDRGREGEKGR
jgi:hypothetical protein